MKSIPEYIQKFKVFISSLTTKDTMAIIVIVLVGLASFGLGRISIGEEISTSSIVIDLVEQSATVYAPEVDTETSSERANTQKSAPLATTGEEAGKFVASTGGSRYHYPWCPSVARIREENKVWFATREDAERAGYTPAKNCPGL